MKTMKRIVITGIYTTASTGTRYDWLKCTWYPAV